LIYICKLHWNLFSVDVLLPSFEDSKRFSYKTREQKDSYRSRAHIEDWIDKIIVDFITQNQMKVSSRDLGKKK
jgi:hypothetical protein